MIEAAEFDCPRSGEKCTGCEACHDGKWTLETCPQKFVTDDIWEAIEAAGFAKDGAWPMAGGTLDQTPWFMDACRQIWAEQTHYQAKLKPPSE